MTRRHVLALPAILAVFALSIPLARAAEDDAATVKRLEEEGIKADLSGNPSAYIKKYLADDMTAGTSFGEWETKSGMLKDAADPANNKVNSEDVSDLKVRVYGNTAIATYRSTYDIVVRGEHRARTVISTDTWVKGKDGWKLVAAHASEAKKTMPTN